ncbi:CDP-diacylglycerol--glycerol-3-phosphate 3-phosphatidyltransferase [Latilactobacillus fuchuensis]|uniref:CDP-diacylglycerol--glycerol-3-phosphate 3-phosphatidyltransferase n=2 Tax=Latilactobacillus fuchuensis TaxID=164393 RepID=A0A2N9DU53_9LACO|nr:CDP-diacylglycerol--glycerol-3-phosphate 3-phosphatidyltransferase [Latilactobacillus fuchuensis]KRL58878.1 pgsA protein [Latilactobacillus fuchuensis DSM 14340 = JCM 11249]SPC37546.1 CDP-diacylglycerol-glycerol-3-phosphate 3-phosphatidyltransferase [Latilactobacillus fuchuensis]
MNLPNKLTMFRIILIPVFTIILVFNLPSSMVSVAGTEIAVSSIIATVIFIIASLTDLLDGKIARSQHLVTNFGKFADPLADKLLVMTAFIFLVTLGQAPAWVVAIIIWRELAVTGLRLLLSQGGEVMAAAMPGKIKTTTQMLAIILLLLNNVFFANIGLPLAQIMLYVCLFFTIYSGVDYFWKNRTVFADSFKQ